MKPTTTINAILERDAANIRVAASVKAATRQGKATNLLDRLKDYDLCVLAFLLVPIVPFTYNHSEQNICMIEVIQIVARRRES